MKKANAVEMVLVCLGLVVVGCSSAVDEPRPEPAPTSGDVSPQCAQCHVDYACDEACGEAKAWCQTHQGQYYHGTYQNGNGYVDGPCAPDSPMENIPLCENLYCLSCVGCGGGT
jgi:hypothetical protein